MHKKAKAVQHPASKPKVHVVKHKVIKVVAASASASAKAKSSTHLVDMALEGIHANLRRSSSTEKAPWLISVLKNAVSSAAREDDNAVRSVERFHIAVLRSGLQSNYQLPSVSKARIAHDQTRPSSSWREHLE